jgi:prephenate dehydrogenase
MGGSLALALDGKCAVLYGIDPNPETVAQAIESGIFKAVSREPGDVLPQADLVILAAPVCSILEQLRELPKLHPGRAVVLDLGSTKRQILEAMAELPERFDPVGGHPMCGKEKSGWANAEASMYSGAAFALSALPRSSDQARSLAEQVARAAGARPLWLEAEVHDFWVAATSHLPYLVACALALATPEETSPLVGPGFCSTTRVAATSPRVMLDILISNAGPILSALDGYQSQLQELRLALENSDWERLDRQLSRAAGQQKVLTGGKL